MPGRGAGEAATAWGAELKRPNTGDEPARILEIISPAGFEKYFDELVELGGSTRAQPEDLAQLSTRYQLEVNPDSIAGLVERFDLRFPGEPI